MEKLDRAASAFYGRVYPDSARDTAHGRILMVSLGERDALITSDRTLGFSGEEREGWLECPLTHGNAAALRRAFPFTAPCRVLELRQTMGVGDRLGICCPGHIRAFRAHPGLKPVFAQQSIRELTLTGRSYDDVLDCVSFAVFREGYEGGFGADGDHLKTRTEVEYALDCGYTMITLDCSEHIKSGETGGALESELEEFYLGRAFELGEGLTISLDRPSLERAARIYGDAIAFATKIYHDLIASDAGDRADFELSIDETHTPTTPEQHFFVASELKRRGVHAATVAPRFVGEFQKGVDYIGDSARFEMEMAAHAAIARHFGYKLSIHSGSDKFSVFPAIARQTRGHFHVKTAGTNWLQAMLLIAQVDPALYREVHAFALEVFDSARKYYHVTTDIFAIPPLSELSDEQLPGLFQHNDARQLIHITYGQILSALDERGAPRFKDRLFSVWRREEEALSALVASHIGRHTELLGC